jgi:hypothetical protein
MKIASAGLKAKLEAIFLPVTLTGPDRRGFQKRDFLKYCSPNQDCLPQRLADDNPWGLKVRRKSGATVVKGGNELCARPLSI